MKKYLLKIFIFLTILILFLVLKNATQPYYTGNLNYKSKLSFFKKNQSEYNAVFFGSSRIYRQVNNAILDSLLIAKDIPFLSYNFGLVGVYNPQSYYLYDNFLDNLKSNNIQYAFLELQKLNLITLNAQTTKGSYWNNYKYYKYSYNYIESSNYSDSLKKEFHSSYNKSFIYKFIDLHVVKNYFLSNGNKKEFIHQGFYSLEDEMNNQKNGNGLEKRWKDFRSDTTTLQERIKAAKITASEIPKDSFNKEHYKILNYLLEKSSEKGIHLFFILPPRLPLEDYSELIPICDSLRSEHVILTHNDPELYLTKNTFDIGHLNNSGSEYYTQLLSNNVSQKIMSKNILFK